LVFLKVDHEQLESCAGNLLLFDAHNAANAMGWVHNILVGPKTMSLLWLLLLLRHYSRLTFANLQNRHAALLIIHRFRAQTVNGDSPYHVEGALSRLVLAVSKKRNVDQELPIA